MLYKRLKDIRIPVKKKARIYKKQKHLRFAKAKTIVNNVVSNIDLKRSTQNYLQ